jgi:hypothetical protein
MNIATKAEYCKLGAIYHNMKLSLIDTVYILQLYVGFVTVTKVRASEESSKVKAQRQLTIGKAYAASQLTTV